MRPAARDDFQRFSFLSALRFSPEGGRAAFVVSRCPTGKNEYESNIWMIPAACKPGEKPVRLTGTGKEKDFSWEDENTLLFASARTPEEVKHVEAKDDFTAFYRLDVRGGEASFAFSVDLPGASAEKVFENGGHLVRARVLSETAAADQGKPKKDDKAGADKDKPTIDSASFEVLDEIPFWFNGQGFINKKRNRLYLRDDNGTLKNVSAPLEAVSAYALNPAKDQVVYAAAAYDAVHPQCQALHLFDLRTMKDTVILEGGKYDIQAAAFWDGRIVFAGSDKARYGTSQNKSIYTIGLDGSGLKMLAGPDRDLFSAIATDCRYGAAGETFKVVDGKLYFTMNSDNASNLYRLSQDGKLEALSAAEGSLDMFSHSGREILFAGLRDMGLQEIYRLEAGGKETKLTGFNDEILKEIYIARPKKISFTNADGVRIDGWYLEPYGFDASRTYPAILDIHGGPKVAAGEVFYHEMQYWAGRGYFVMFCNPRGSGGRGNEFADLRDRYGTVDYDDIMAFTDRVLDAAPQIDRKKVCVTGGSYGGFMTNWIIGHTGRFAAAASQRSIANWVSKCLTTDIGYYHNLSQIAGDPWTTPEKFWDKSPLKYVPAVTTPTLFIHSNEDYRCWMAEGLQMFTALKMRGVESRLCLFKGENHELSRSGKPANRLRRLKEITDWFDRHVGKELDAG